RAVPLVAGCRWWEGGMWVRDLCDGGGNILVQQSRMVLERGRLRRPERFFAGFAHVAFPQEMPHAQNLQKRCGQRLCLCLYGTIAPTSAKVRKDHRAYTGTVRK